MFSEDSKLEDSKLLDRQRLSDAIKGFNTVNFNKYELPRFDEFKQSLEDRIKIRSIKTLKEVLSDANHGYINLSGLNLSKQDLQDLHFNNVNLFGTNFAGTNLTKSDFRDANLIGVNFSWAILTETQFISDREFSDMAAFADVLSRLNRVTFSSSIPPPRDQWDGSILTLPEPDENFYAAVLADIIRYVTTAPNKDEILRAAYNHPFFTQPGILSTAQKLANSAFAFFNQEESIIETEDQEALRNAMSPEHQDKSFMISTKK